MQEKIESIMAQARRFAGAWDKVDGPEDDGAALDKSNAEEAKLRSMLEQLLALDEQRLQALAHLRAITSTTSLPIMDQHLLAAEKFIQEITPCPECYPSAG